MDSSPSMTIGVITPFVSGYYMSSLLYGMQRVAEVRGARLLVVQGTPGDIAAARLLTGQVAGWLVLLNTTGLSELRASGRPVVIVGAAALAAGDATVYTDNAGGVERAVAHLVEHGHTRIGFIGYMAPVDIQQRFAGYQTGLRAHGLPFDPALVASVPYYNEIDGEQGGAQLLAAQPTAIIAATDRNAIGAIRALRAANLRVPEDVAVIGFDDDDVAQHADPPLTTLRQQGDLLGATALTRLLAVLDGQPDAGGPAYVKAALVVRQSCGCRDPEITAPELDILADWEPQLAHQLAAMLQAPQVLDLATPATTIWAAAPALPAALAAALTTAPLPGIEELSAIWASALDRTANLTALTAMLRLIDQVAHHLLAAAPAPTRARILQLNDRIRAALLSAQSTREATWRGYVEGQIANIEEVSAALLGESLVEAKSLSWLRETPADWGALLFWEGAAGSALATIGTFTRAGAALVAAERYDPAALPPPAWFAHGGHTVLALLPITTAHRGWGYLALAGGLVLGPRLINRINETVPMWLTLLGASLDRAAIIESLQSQQETLRLSYEEARALADTVRALGAPLIPLLPGVLLIPLIGAIDTGRARQIMETVLAGISHHRATTVLLDVTGVPVVDAPVANALIQLAQAAALLGASVTLVGVRPEIAQSIVGLGVSLAHLTTQASLAAAMLRLDR